jgi:hypothetical protein
VHRCEIRYLIFDGFLVNQLREITCNGMTNMRHLIISATHGGAGPGVARRRRAGVADLWFVLLTVGLFAVLALLVKAVERL